MRVFLSYRRADDLFLAGRLRDRLAEDFGEENVFFDVDSVPPGTDFRDVTRERIDAADVVVALIGSRWDSTRLARTNDHVRIELGQSVRQHKPLIPVLIADTAMPAPDELPEELVTIAFLHALRIRPDPDFRDDSARLVEAITDAKERELARAAEELEDLARIVSVEDASRVAGETRGVTSQGDAGTDETAEVAADAEVAGLRAPQETTESATVVSSSPQISDGVRSSGAVIPEVVARDFLPFRWMDFILPVLVTLFLLFNHDEIYSDLGIVWNALTGGVMILALIGLVVFPIRYYRRRRDPYQVAKMLALSDVTLAVAVAVTSLLAAPSQTEGNNSVADERFWVSIGSIFFGLLFALISFAIFVILNKLRVHRSLEARTETQ